MGYFRICNHSSEISKCLYLFHKGKHIVHFNLFLALGFLNWPGYKSWVRQGDIFLTLFFLSDYLIEVTTNPKKMDLFYMWHVPKPWLSCQILKVSSVAQKESQGTTCIEESQRDNFPGFLSLSLMILARGLQFSSGLDPQLENFLSKWVYSVRAYLVIGHIQKYNTGIFELYLDRKLKKKKKRRNWL